MQQFPVYNEVIHSAETVSVRRRVPRQIAGSRSLASMLPSLLISGLLTLMLTAVLRVLWIGYQAEFFSAWMEAWLTTWPIAFPLAYLSLPLIKKLSRYASRPVGPPPAGLHVQDVHQVSEQASRQQRLKRRPLQASSLNHYIR